MSGKKSKLLRRMVNNYVGSERKYSEANHRPNFVKAKPEDVEADMKAKGFRKILQKIKEKTMELWVVFSFTVVADPLRREYQDLKKWYKRVPKNLRGNL